jgi:hypothetical protein
MPVPGNSTLSWVLQQCFDDPEFYKALCDNTAAALEARSCSVSDDELLIIKGFSESVRFESAGDPEAVFPNVRSVMEYMFTYTAPKPDGGTGGVAPVWGKTNTDV